MWQSKCCKVKSYLFNICSCANSLLLPSSGPCGETAQSLTSTAGSESYPNPRSFSATGRWLYGGRDFVFILSHRQCGVLRPATIDAASLNSVSEERPSRGKVIATVTGFLGVLIVLRPSQFHCAALFALVRHVSWHSLTYSLAPFLSANLS